MSINKTLLAVVGVGMLAFVLGACEQQGPAEQAGEKIDETAEETGEAMDKAADKTKEATE